MKTYYGVDFKKQREKLLSSTTAQPLINCIISKADAAIGKTYPSLKISEYMLYAETGNRSIFEKSYFEKRNNCAYISIAFWLTYDEKYVKPLIDLVFAICDEFTWCLPAHVYLADKPSVQTMIETVDLFQSETARLLTDIAVSVGDKLPYYINERIAYEIKRRIIISMKNASFGWEHANSNWAAVCSGGVAIALVHFGEQAEIDLIMPRLYKAIESFLSGYNDDGCCMEGYAYWNYGFGYFLIFARMVLDYTNGEINYFKNEKVKQIAMYPQRVRMGNSRVASFSDGVSCFSYSPGCMSYLKSIYGDDIILPDLQLATMNGNVYSIKELLWFDTEYKADNYSYEKVFFNNSEWFVCRKEKFSFAAKGGHNDEQHNHNDVGSFMIVTGDTVPLDDVGSGEYVKESFDNRTRYNYFVNSSRGHSVPVINGKHQCFGKDYKASNVKSDGDNFSLDIEGAYEKGIINKIHRSFSIKENSVILKDIFEYSDKTENITERFISRIKPEISDSCVDLKTAKILFDKNKYYVNWSSEIYKGHNCDDVTAYIIDFMPIKEKETDFVFEIMTAI